jgi:4-amino-4-deoxy-L-arabinose transferase-like glycosyltransferase
MHIFIIFAFPTKQFMLKALQEGIVNLTQRQLISIVVVLCLPAFFLNLGLLAFIGDEAIRGLVALEMSLSGDFIVPTLHGDQYFNKPPLYNWFIYLMSQVFGYFGEWPARMTTLIFLAIFAVTVYHFVRKPFGQLTALTMALMLLTSGRILFWDSMLGLIDICFSWVIYLNFMILYTMARAQQWRRMFIFSYLLFSIAFLLKGLPAVVFQGISILTALQLHGVLKKKIFAADHWIGIGLGILPLIGYYAVYASRVDLEHVFSILFDQSMQRTATHHGLWKTVTHFFIFPFEQLYHFLPWSLLLIIGFHPNFMKWVGRHEFIRFNFWMLLTNLPVYWLSVQVLPRYVLMFIPLFNLVGYFALQESLQLSDRWWNLLRKIFLGLASFGCLAIAGMPVAEQVRAIPGIWFIWIIGSILMAACLFALLKDSQRTFLWFAVSLLIIRSVFNLVVLPLRKADFTKNKSRDACELAVQRHGDRAWYVYGQTNLNEVAGFYTSAFSNQIIHRTDIVVDSAAYYLVDEALYPDFPGVVIDSVMRQNGLYVALMRPKP